MVDDNPYKSPESKPGRGRLPFSRIPTPLFIVGGVFCLLHATVTSPMFIASPEMERIAFTVSFAVAAVGVILIFAPVVRRYMRH